MSTAQVVGNYGAYTPLTTNAVKVYRIRSARSASLFSLQLVGDTSTTPYFGSPRANGAAADGNMVASRGSQDFVLASGTGYNDGPVIDGPNTYDLGVGDAQGIESATFQIDSTGLIIILWTQADGSFVQLFPAQFEPGRLGYFANTATAASYGVRVLRVVDF